MSNEQLTQFFYNHLKEFEGGLMNLIKQLGDQHQDAIQDTLERLIKANNKNNIKFILIFIF